MIKIFKEKIQVKSRECIHSLFFFIIDLVKNLFININ